MVRSDKVPDVITRYLQATDANDSKGAAACFAEDGTVLDEGVTYVGRAQIVSWREKSSSQWTYTSRVVGSEAITDDQYRVHVLVEGNFPGGKADLAFNFTFNDDVIVALIITD
jgi:hypothetical protein